MGWGTWRGGRTNVVDWCNQQYSNCTFLPSSPYLLIYLLTVSLRYFKMRNDYEKIHQNFRKGIIKKHNWCTFNKNIFLARPLSLNFHVFFQRTQILSQVSNSQDANICSTQNETIFDKKLFYILLAQNFVLTK